MGPGWDRTRDPWIYSQTHLCSQTRYRLRYAARWIHYCEHEKSWSDFGDLDLIFKVTSALWNAQNTVYVRYILQIWTSGWFWPNLHRYNVGRVGSVGQILVTLTSFSRSHWHFKISEIGFPCAIFWTIGWILAKLDRYIGERMGRVDYILVTLP